MKRQGRKLKFWLYYGKSVEENASLYFEKAKKLKKKLKGALEAIEATEKKLASIKKSLRPVSEEDIVAKPKRKKEWYEKFRWFFSSEGFLVIGGRDATTNEIIIKKYAEPHDIVFHTDMAGSPFFVVKTSGKKPGKATIQEAADATASFSRAWAKGLSSIAVFHVKPEQVSKTPKAGEFLPKGAFVIKGKTTYVKPRMELAIANKDGVIICGPVQAIEKQADDFLLITQGDMKKSDVAKKVRSKIGGDLDEIMHMLPPGPSAIGKRRR